MSTTTNKINNTKAGVKVLITKFPELRDNDNKLVSAYWRNQLHAAGLNPSDMSCDEFLQHHSAGNLVKSDVITRARRGLEELYPQLRGETWEERQTMGSVVAQNISKNA